ncbi:alkaline phosphatase D family protein [Algivirga pacifica]|uniref:PhoD-like phosphatase metallophosphatase domain-containing protein n=1 Tax=Algivirga pacifica TaxID=1162670 RepID=A0ABP9DJX2_9BACT
MRLIPSFTVFLLLLFFTAYASAQDTLKITFGSCNNQDKPQHLWDDILSDVPDIWVWLGDNIYGEGQDAEGLRRLYLRQKQHPDYEKLLATAFITGIWDDHDYGVNDGGKHFLYKRESQKEFLDFLAVSANDHRRTQKGIYTVHWLDQKSGIKVRLILLDTRYFRDDAIRTKDGYTPNEKGSILGKEQWSWLEKELKENKAEITLFASGIQVIPAEHRFEKWSNFPNERKKLFNLIRKYKVAHPIILSGDRHIAEISRIEWKRHTILEVTSSSLTHSYGTNTFEPNAYRVGKLINVDNYGLLQVWKENDQVVYKVQLKGEGGVILQEFKE